MKSLSSQKGQGVVELVLLMAASISIVLFVQSYIRENEFTQKLFGKPWATLSGMIECGVWEPCRPDVHPNSSTRIRSTVPR
jgi:hypothetical protein